MADQNPHHHPCTELTDRAPKSGQDFPGSAPTTLCTPATCAPPLTCTRLQHDFVRVGVSGICHVDALDLALEGERRLVVVVQ